MKRERAENRQMANEAQHITIVLCTYNGARYLQEQLDSFAAQCHQNWSLIVSDDGSSDETLAVLDRFVTRAAGQHAIKIVTGPQKGATANYLSALAQGYSEGVCVALADQDDVWLPDKLARALHQMAAHQGLKSSAPPVLYGARSLHVSADLQSIGQSGVWRRPASFGNALCQNIVSGHSAVLNPAAARIIAETATGDLPALHDWWIYQLISASPDGMVMVDNQIVAKYRQHDSNTIGFRQGAKAGIKRLSMLFGGEFQTWFDAQTRALQARRSWLTPSAQQALSLVLETKRGAGFARPVAFYKAGIYRQSIAGTMCIYLAAATGRI